MTSVTRKSSPIDVQLHRRSNLRVGLIRREFIPYHNYVKRVTGSFLYSFTSILVVLCTETCLIVSVMARNTYRCRIGGVVVNLGFENI